MKYRSKAVEIEAMQATGKNCYELMHFMNRTQDIFDAELFQTDLPVINTLEGNLRVSIGDWIIKGTEGEFYTCKDSVFQRKYEPVEEPPRCKHGVLALDRCWDCDPNIGQVEVEK
jgi:hypothetical protein